MAVNPISDYSELIDDEIRAFIEQTNAHYPPDAVRLSIAAQRAVYDQMCAAFRRDYPTGVSAQDSVLTGPHAVPMRTYTPATPSAKAHILYYHGGGFVVGGLDSHDEVCADLCARTGLSLSAVDYRLAPEHTHPAAFEDALAAYQHWQQASDAPLILAGDSAGATLAAAVAHAVRGQTPYPLGQVLIYPALGGDNTRGSYVTHAAAPLLSTQDVAFYQATVAGGAATAQDPRINPLADSDFSGLPPTTIITAQCDPLSDDGRDYRDGLLAAGVAAEWVNEAGLVHGYLRARHSSARAAASFERIVAALKRYANGA